MTRLCVYIYIKVYIYIYIYIYFFKLIMKIINGTVLENFIQFEICCPTSTKKEIEILKIEPSIFLKT